MRPKRPKKAAKRGQEGPKNRKQVTSIRNGAGTEQDRSSTAAVAAAWQVSRRRSKTKYTEKSYTPAPARQGAADLLATPTAADPWILEI